MGRAMKDSGVEWIGEIPEEWEKIRFKYLNVGMNTGEGIDKDYWSNNENDTVFYTAGLLPIYTTYQDFPDWKYTGENDLLLARNGTPYVYFPVCNACYTDHIIRATLKKDVNRRFVRYGLQQSISSVVINQVSIATWSASLWNEQVIPFPPLSDQQKIADFLDHKCSEIDAVLNTTYSSIEEYKHLKQAIITQAVTKGVRGDRAMRDSGIDWLGEIPIEWNILPLRYLGTCQNGISKGGEYFGSGFPFVSYGDVYKNYSLPDDVEGKILSTEAERNLYSVKEGDVFFTRTSETIEEVAFSAVCLKTIKNATYAGFLIRFRPDTDMLTPNYSKYYFRCERNRNFFVKEMNLVTRASLSQELLKRFPVLLPSCDEQLEIASYLDQKCAEIDALISQKEQLLAELENYKKSLIYEYVTGKKEVPLEY